MLPLPVGRLPEEVRGRAGVLRDLAELARHPDGRVQVLAGLGGSGKSTVALAVARDASAAAEAEAEFGDVLAGRLRILGPDHPDTVIAQHYAAVTLADQGRLADAEAAFRQVLAKKLEILGPEHPSTLSTRHWIAAVLDRQGNRSRPKPNPASCFKRGSRSWAPSIPVPWPPCMMSPATSPANYQRCNGTQNCDLVASGRRKT